MENKAKVLGTAALDKFSKEKADQVQYFNRVLEAFINKLNEKKDKEEEAKNQ